MSKRLLYGLGAILLIVSAVLVAWQGSFNIGDFGPKDPGQTFVFFGISTFIFLLMVTLGFMLVRLIVKLWIERRGNRIGSRIRTKLVVGALALSIMPVFFMVLQSFYVMNNALEHWFTRPVEHERIAFVNIANTLRQATREKAAAEAQLLATLPATRDLLAGVSSSAGFIDKFAKAHELLAVRVWRAERAEPLAAWGAFPTGPEPEFEAAEAPIYSYGGEIGRVRIASPIPINIAQQRKDIEKYDQQFAQLRDQKKLIRTTSLQLLTLIALFILFVASWLAQFFARQISGPISALLHGAEEVSKGNLRYRVEVNAIDELARLVEGFNRMTADLEANRAEIESRRRFTEAILESIPTGVISVDSIGKIQRVNKALAVIFPDVQAATRLDDLFPPEDAAEIRYLMNRARRTGLATQQIEVKTAGKTIHLSITVSALEGPRSSGFVIVLEDTSDLLRAQKTAAWSEVARRVAHEIKNPLTPITLSAERIVRQANRNHLPAGMDRIVRECAEIILNETASVKRLVDEFSQFSRFPAARPVQTDLNEVVRNGLAVFEGRLENLDLRVDLAPNLPMVSLDPEQFKRVVVNLVDNAAEAMANSPARSLTVETRLNESDAVELTFADTGSGITADQKEKLFLPYFSTKGRGTGLGLAIVSHILAEHNCRIRVEDNKPCGARFIIEVPVLFAAETEPMNVIATA